MRVERVTLNEDLSASCPAVRGYVTTDYDGPCDGYWWLACILQTLPDSGYLKFIYSNSYFNAKFYLNITFSEHECFTQTFKRSFVNFNLVSCEIFTVNTVNYYIYGWH